PGASPPPAAAGTRSPATPSAPANGPPFFQPPVTERPQFTADHRDALLRLSLNESSYPIPRYPLSASHITICAYPSACRGGSRRLSSKPPFNPSQLCSNALG